MLTLAITDTCILSCRDASSKLGDLGFGIHIDEVYALRNIRCDGVSDLLSDSPSSCVKVRVCQVDAVAGFGYLIAGFREGFDWKLSYGVETCISGKSTAVTC